MTFSVLILFLITVSVYMSGAGYIYATAQGGCNKITLGIGSFFLLWVLDIELSLSRLLRKHFYLLNYLGHSIALHFPNKQKIQVLCLIASKWHKKYWMH